MKKVPVQQNNAKGKKYKIEYVYDKMNFYSIIQAANKVAAQDVFLNETHGEWCKINKIVKLK